MSMAAMQLEREHTLDRLLRGIDGASLAVPPVALNGISSDSRSLKPGFAFFACRGAAGHGLDYLPQALAAGVSAVVWDSDTAADEPPDTAAVMVPVAGLRRHLGEIANRWFAAPSTRLRISGVTGTNGKTTVAWLLAQCLQQLDRPCAYVGTLGAGIAGALGDSGLTTPGCIELHRELAGFLSAGAQCVALEVSSHALHQKRIDGVHFDSAIFTNLSRDHMDYHGDMQAYFNSKAQLFLDCEPEYRIVNTDSEAGARLLALCANRNDDKTVAVSSRIGRGPKAEADGPFVFARASDTDAHGSLVSIESSWGAATFRLPLAGDFNVANAALVLAQLLCWQVPLAAAVQTLSGVRPPPGRMQRVAAGEPSRSPAVYVDYAHTPAGLEAALRSLRSHCGGKLWCVFGCGGDRDRGKRPLMGATAERLADRPVLTNDNPRSEDPDDIVAEVLGGMVKRAIVIPDRAAAIAYAIGKAGVHDLVLIAGKGHENVQLIGGRRLPFSDYETARRCLTERAQRP